MMDNISFEELDSFYYRKNKMRGCLQELLDVLNGRTIGIRELICEDGKPSKTKRNALIEELMDSLKTYMQYRLSASGTQHGIHAPEKAGDEMALLNEKRYQCLVGFLSCTLDHLAKDPASDLADLVDLSSDVHIHFSYIDLLAAHFKERVDRKPVQKQMRTVHPDRYLNYARLYGDDPDRRNPDFVGFMLWHLFPIDGWEDLGDIMNFRYQMDASEREIDMMLGILERHHIEVPENWLDDYERDKELYKEQRHHGYRFVADNDHIVAFWNFLHLQEYMLSSAAFENAISGMIDLYVLRNGSSILPDSDGFYEVYERLDRIRSLALKTKEKKEGTE